jgi:hypothetical protein
MMNESFTHELHITVHLFGKSDTEESHDQVVVHRLITANSEQDLLSAIDAAQTELYEERHALASEAGDGLKDPHKRFRLELAAQKCPAFKVVDTRGMNTPASS